MSILLTGFQPFGEFTLNPSELVAKHFGGISLPVVQTKSFEVLKVEIQTRKPDAIVMIGIAGGSEKIRLERIAINLDDYPIPDNEGNQAKEQRIIHDAPDAYFSTLPLRAIHEELLKYDLPVQFSLSAGTYICNHLFFQTMHYLFCQEINIPSGFIHIPNSIDLKVLLNAFEIITNTIKKSL